MDDVDDVESLTRIRNWDVCHAPRYG
jgi:hypothetical protein